MVFAKAKSRIRHAETGEVYEIMPAFSTSPRSLVKNAA